MTRIIEGGGAGLTGDEEEDRSKGKRRNGQQWRKREKKGSKLGEVGKRLMGKYCEKGRETEESDCKLI